MTKHDIDIDDSSSGFDIVCDLCETTFAQDQLTALGGWSDNKPDGSITISTGVNDIDICPTCRYQGAPSKHEEIIRALKALRLAVSQAKLNVSDNGYRIARLAPSGEYYKRERVHVLESQTKAYNALGSIESTINLLATSLEDQLNLDALDARHARENNEESKALKGDIYHE